MRPLLKWAGGKRQLLPILRRYYPPDFDAYLEPFLGSGAVFFDLYATGRLGGRRVRLTDVSADLIGCYVAVRDDPERVIAELRALEEEHRMRGAECYYDVRDRRFNPARAALHVVSGSGRTSSQAVAGYTPALAAMLIYLNRAGYNGLFRLNRRGQFNVPAGRYANPSICDPGHVRNCARALSAAGVILECAPFDVTLATARTGDFIYCDPPYAPISRTASFAQYTAGGFGGGDHRRLEEAVIAAARRGATVLVSNSSAPEIAAAYAAPAARVAGLSVKRIEARRAINSKAAARGPVEELIITNAAARQRHAPAMEKLRMAKSAIGTRRRLHRTSL